MADGWCVGCFGAQVHRFCIFVPNPVLWSRQRYCKWIDHAEVCICFETLKLLIESLADGAQLCGSMGVTEYGRRLHLRSGAMIG